MAIGFRRLSYWCKLRKLYELSETFINTGLLSVPVALAVAPLIASPVAALVANPVAPVVAPPVVWLLFMTNNY